MAFDFIRIILMLAEGLFSVFLGYLLYRKQPEERLNQVFALSYLLFGGFFLIQMPIYLLSPLGVEAYPFMPVIQLFRDVSNAFGIFATASLLLVSFIISRGSTILENRPLVTIYSGIIFILAVIGELNDHVVLHTEDGTHSITTLLPFGILICFILPLFLAVAAVLHFFYIWLNMEDSFIKKNVLYFSIGLSIIICGLVFQTVIVTLFGDEPFAQFPILDYLVYIIWATGQIVAAQGIMRKKT